MHRITPASSQMDPHAEVVEAVVMTGAVETPYRRAGRGASALLLAAGTGLFEAMATTLRVLEPLRRPDPDGPEWEPWLQGFMDGLGLDRPTVVVDARTAPAVRRMAAADPDRFGPVVDAASPPVVRDRLRDANEIIDG